MGNIITSAEVGKLRSRIKELEAENTTLRGFKEDIEYVAEREAHDDKELAKAVKERIDAYGDQNG